MEQLLHLLPLVLAQTLYLPQLHQRGVEVAALRAELPEQVEVLVAADQIAAPAVLEIHQLLHHLKAIMVALDKQMVAAAEVGRVLPAAMLLVIMAETAVQAQLQHLQEHL